MNLQLHGWEKKNKAKARHETGQPSKKRRAAKPFAALPLNCIIAERRLKSNGEIYPSETGSKCPI